MIRIFLISLRLQIAYRINTILYRLQNVLRRTKLFPEQLFGAQWLKTMSTVLATAWEVLSVFLTKFVYVLMLYIYATYPISGIAEGSGATFLTFYLLFSLAGGLVNTWMLTFAQQDYYALVLMRMDARRRSLSMFLYAAIRSIVGSLPFVLIFGTLLGVSWWVSVVSALLPTAVKAIVIAVLFGRYERTESDQERFKLNQPLGRATLAVTVALAVSPFLLRVFELSIPVTVTAGVTVGLILVAGCVAGPIIARFPRYPEICKMGALQAVSTLSDIAVDRARRKQADSAIRFDATQESSGKTGLAFLNQLFIRRHRRILWTASFRYALFCLAVAVVAVTMFLAHPDDSPDPVNFLPWSLLVLYFVNRGRVFTQTLYLNCDHSLLTYAVYKQPDRILELFRLRLWEITKINLLPTTVLALGMVMLMAVWNPARPAYEYVLAFLTIEIIGVFLSLHYLAMYYLLQPYTTEARITSIPYQIATSLTYGVCYLIAVSVKNPSLVIFGGACLAFGVVYLAAALALVYVLAPRTFHIRA